jgi:hypothetical protein
MGLEVVVIVGGCALALLAVCRTVRCCSNGGTEHMRIAITAIALALSLAGSTRADEARFRDVCFKAQRASPENNGIRDELIVSYCSCWVRDVLNMLHSMPVEDKNRVAGRAIDHGLPT